MRELDAAYPDAPTTLRLKMGDASIGAKISSVFEEEVAGYAIPSPKGTGRDGKEECPHPVRREGEYRHSEKLGLISFFEKRAAVPKFLSVIGVSCPCHRAIG